jgi:hypothetical protein
MATREEIEEMIAYWSGFKAHATRPKHIKHADKRLLELQIELEAALPAPSTKQRED